MTDKKPTDSEIVKALECCASVDNGCSTDCPLYGGDDSCFSTLLKPTLDLINRQKAEIERLLKIEKKMHTWIFLNSYDEDKAYKECGLTDEENALLGYGGKIILEDKEMVGEDK